MSDRYKVILNDNTIYSNLSEKEAYEKAEYLQRKMKRRWVEVKKDKESSERIGRLYEELKRNL